MTTHRHERTDVDRAALLRGFLIGLSAGALAAVLKLSRLSRVACQRRAENPRNSHKPPVPGDPVTKEMTEGKAAARRRRTELGLDA